MRKLYKPGEDNLPPGRYEEVGPRGGDVSGKHVRIDSGERLPPTTQPGRRYRRI